MLIVGYGLMGKRRHNALRPLDDVRVTAIVEPKDKGCWQSVADIPADTYDAAFVCVPHDEAKRAVMQLGEDASFLTEKPGGLNADEVCAVASAAHNAPDCFAGYSYRFLPHVAEAIRLANSGDLGEILACDVTIGHGGSPEMRGTWKADAGRNGGVLLDLGVHAFDLIRQLAPSARVTASSAQSLFWGCTDDAAVSLGVTGFHAMASVSLVRWVNTFRFEVFGKDGYAICEGRGGTYGPMTLRVGRRWAWHGAAVSQRETEAVTGYGSHDRSIEDETAAAVACWQGRACERRPASLADAVKAAWLVEDARKAAVTA